VAILQRVHKIPRKRHAAVVDFRYGGREDAAEFVMLFVNK